MPNTQTDSKRCDCGHSVAVEPTGDPWQFTVAPCAHCGHGSLTIAWATSEPPPIYEASPRLPFRATED